MLHKRIIVVCLSAIVFLAGCHSPVYNQTEANVADVTQRAQDARIKAAALAKPIPALVVNQGLYVDKTPISLTKEPVWLKNRIVVRGDQLPFSYYSRTIVSGGGRNILTRYQIGLDDKIMVSMNYTGTVKGALDMLAAKTGYVYSVSGANVYWQAFITKTFDIAFMPGSSDYLMGKTASGGGAGGAAALGGGGGGGAGGTGTTVTGIIDDSAASQYSNLKGTLSVWKDLETSIKELLSADGKVMVSEATTSVTVRDRPTNVSLISQFISNLNNNLSKQVLVKVEILQITLENDFNFGINWNAVQRAFGNGNIQLVSNNGAPLSLTSASQLTLNTTRAGLSNPLVDATSAAGATGVTALINALQMQGKVSIVTQPQVLCQNNQVSQIRLVDQLGYLASIQTTAFSGGTGTTAPGVTSQITPGAVVTGLTLYVLPKILGNKVFLQVNADLSTFLGLTTVTSNGVEAGSSNTAASAIQVPHVTQKQFNQRGVIASGDTLILAGFRQVDNRAGAAQMFQSQSLGGKTAQEVNTETVVLITPIILHGLA